MYDHYKLNQLYNKRTTLEAQMQVWEALRKHCDEMIDLARKELYETRDRILDITHPVHSEGWDGIK